MQSLYAAKMLALLENQTSSKLPVGMVVESLGKVLLRQGTASSLGQNFPSPGVPLGRPVRYQLVTAAALMPYWLLVGWNSRHEMDILVPGAGLMEYAGVAHEPGGAVTVYLLVSDRPFSRTLAHLAIDDTTTTLLNLPQPLPTMQAIMQDLAVDELDGNYRFDVDRYAALRLQYQLTV